VEVGAVVGGVVEIRTLIERWSVGFRGVLLSVVWVLWVLGVLEVFRGVQGGIWDMTYGKGGEAVCRML
jgi:hypothetical protein